MTVQVQEVVRRETTNTVHPFSWLSTQKVCQRWAAFYAALPGQLESNVV